METRIPYIRQWREHLGWSQTELGNRCKPPVAREQISNYEREDQEPRPETLRRIAEALFGRPAVAMLYQLPGVTVYPCEDLTDFSMLCAYCKKPAVIVVEPGRIRVRCETCEIEEGIEVRGRDDDTDDGFPSDASEDIP